MFFAGRAQKQFQTIQKIYDNLDSIVYALKKTSENQNEINNNIKFISNKKIIKAVNSKKKDVQNLIDLGNASRRVKGVTNNMDIDYVVGSGETISTVAFKYGTTSSKP